MYERLGEARLRAIIDRFVDRIFDDVMIGFFFQRVSRERLKQKEFEFAAQHLGAALPYTGRPLDRAHQKHPIMGGQFMRRLQILKDVLAEYEVPDDIRAHWIAHTEALRPLVTRDQPDICQPGPALEKALAAKDTRDSEP